MRINWNCKTPLPVYRIVLRRAIRRGQRHRLIVTSTNGGQHAEHSYHKVLRAVDMGGSLADMTRFQQEEYFRHKRYVKRHNRPLYQELFGPDNRYCISQGHPVTLAEHSALEDLHDNHVHAAR